MFAKQLEGKSLFFGSLILSILPIMMAIPQRVNIDS